MKTKKEFDSVSMMRDIRDKLYAVYKKNPELRQERLEAIRKKYEGRILHRNTETV
jgi:hypothetical protein